MSEFTMDSKFSARHCKSGLERSTFNAHRLLCNCVVRTQALPAHEPHGPQSNSLHRLGNNVIKPGVPDQRRHVVPSVAHFDFVKTPLSAPLIQPSHQMISLPLGSVDLYGNYSIQGPAVIKKVNNTMVALVQPGGLISVLSSAEVGPTHMSSASISHDDSEAALCTLVGHHLELDGRFTLQDEHEAIEHDGKTIVSVDHLSDDNFITLLPGGSVSHPINVCPHTR